MESNILPDRNFVDTENVSSSLKPVEELNEQSPLCLQDVTTRLPDSFITLLSSLPENALDSNKIIVAVLYTLAIECGYTSNVDTIQSPYQRCYSFNKSEVDAISSETLLLTIRNSNEYTVNVYLGSVQDFHCILLITPYLNGMLVNFYTTSTNPSVSFTKVIAVSEYIIKNQLNLKKLKELCIECMDGLFNPMKIHILRENSIKGFSLLNLPFEILFKLMGMLDFKDFCNFCSTCSFLHENFSLNENVWKNYCLQYGFPNLITNSWRINFKESWERIKIRSRRKITGERVNRSFIERIFVVS